jgi:hypothetical protein
MNKTTLIEQLLKKYPKMLIFADGNGWTENSPDCFSVSAEEPVMDSRGYDMFNYYDLGVSTELTAFLEKSGYFAQWVNPGVIGIYKD